MCSGPCSILIQFGLLRTCHYAHSLQRIACVWSCPTSRRIWTSRCSRTRGITPSPTRAAKQERCGCRPSQGASWPLHQAKTALDTVLRVVFLEDSSYRVLMWLISEVYRLQRGCCRKMAPSPKDCRTYLKRHSHSHFHRRWRSFSPENRCHYKLVEHTCYYVPPIMSIPVTIRVRESDWRVLCFVQ